MAFAQRKNYVFDTSVLMHDPKSFLRFKGNDVYIPIIVIEELDNLKKSEGLKGFQAREAMRSLNGTIDGYGKIATSEEGIALADNIKLHVTDYYHGTENKFIKNDDLIISSAIEVSKQKERPTILVSKDLCLRLRAGLMGVDCQDYESDKIVESDLYSGYTTLELSEKKINKIFEGGFKLPKGLEMLPHQFAFVRSKEKLSNQAIVRFDGSMLVPLSHDNKSAWGLHPINAEQKMAFELLMDPKIPFVSITGGAGSGKTILATAVALEKVIERKEYRKIIFVRPVTPAGHDIGYLPGTEEDKLRPWMGSFYDAIENLMSFDVKSKKGRMIGTETQVDMFIDDLRKRGQIETKTFTYMRGRTLTNAFVIVDEAQEMTPHLAKLMLTRSGHNTKFVLLGDPSDNQIDNTMVDSRSNGLAYVVEKLKNSEITGHVTLNQVERSGMAKLAEKYL